MLANTSAPIPRQSTSAGLGDAAKTFGAALYCLGRRATSAVASTAAAAAAAAVSVADSASQSGSVAAAAAAANPLPAAQPPWSGLEPGPRSQVLALSQDPRNFLRSPPAGCDFEFCLDAALPSAVAALEADPALRQMRFRLVPRRLAEEHFWRNYFYRVDLIQRSAQLSVSTSALATVATEARAPSPISEASSSISGDSFERVPSRDALEAEAFADIDGNDEDDCVEIVGDDWERELQSELAGVEPPTSE